MFAKHLNRLRVSTFSSQRGDCHEREREREREKSCGEGGGKNADIFFLTTIITVFSGTFLEEAGGKKIFRKQKQEPKAFFTFKTSSFLNCTWALSR